MILIISLIVLISLITIEIVPRNNIFKCLNFHAATAQNLNVTLYLFYFFLFLPSSLIIVQKENENNTSSPLFWLNPNFY